jgi:hypothetical protein
MLFSRSFKFTGDSFPSRWWRIRWKLLKYHREDDLNLLRILPPSPSLTCSIDCVFKYRFPLPRALRQRFFEIAIVH